MEVVCLILGPTLTPRPCSHTFRVLTSLHLPLLLKMFFIARRAISMIAFPRVQTIYIFFLVSTCIVYRVRSYGTSATDQCLHI